MTSTSDGSAGNSAGGCDGEEHFNFGELSEKES